MYRCRCLYIHVNILCIHTERKRQTGTEKERERTRSMERERDKERGRESAKDREGDAFQAEGRATYPDPLNVQADSLIKHRTKSHWADEPLVNPHRPIL